MKEIDYSALSTVYILPLQGGVATQPTDGLAEIPLCDAIAALLEMSPATQKRASIAIQGSDYRIKIDEAIAISQRADFPRD